ncbi:periodic tryptophan protein 1 [Kwoniella mangroviensis CBS 10435]|uniref:Periodic tryptophan protein 1 n=1 Tax=Kwoniella mangroviensis CBS 10435 TaxID=1331196 RepID=A0A1B9IT62_9TREE|nr:periodic tryptophan protein 1 [Kwoniella mangroviensis CBS 10435]
MSGTLISSLVWVPRGKSSAEPKRYNLDDTELERVGKLGGPGVLEQLREEMEGMDVGEGEDWEDVDEDDGEGSGSDEDNENAEVAEHDVDMDTEPHEPPKSSDPNDLSAFKMDEYDNEESKGVAMGAFANVKGLSFYRDNNEDPYITLREDDEEIEREELSLLPTDNIIITARTTSDLSSLDFHVYADSDENLYAHHDLMLPTFPLCVEWLDFPPGGSSSSSSGSKGSYVAVGSFDPSIEIWDADLVDGLYPEAILGPSPSSEKPEAKPLGTGKKKRKQMVQPAANDQYHTQPVLSLSWTPNHRNLLLSGSADGTIKLWDLTRESPMPALKSWNNIHKGEKVQGVEWNKSTSNGLDKAVLSAGWDRIVKVWDSRAPEDAIGTQVGSDVECIRWDPWEPTSFFVSLENGLILAYDSRTLSSSKGSNNLSTAQPKYTLSAHDGAASALDINPHIRGCIATGGMDKVVKIWNILDEESEGVQGRKREISLATSRDLGLGKIFTARWSPDPETPLTLAAAGSKATLQVWDVASNPGARKAFGDRLKKHGRELGEVKKGGGVVVVEGGEDEDTDEE